MKLIFALIALTITTSAFADTYVQGHTRKDGTYVQPHYRSAPDSSKYNNYSTQGNSNPYTGQQGNVDPYAIKSYNYEPPKLNTYQNPYGNN